MRRRGKGDTLRKEGRARDRRPSVLTSSGILLPFSLSVMIPILCFSTLSISCSSFVSSSLLALHFVFTLFVCFCTFLLFSLALQAKALLIFSECLSEQSLRSTVVLTAARGRGKSAALGLAITAAVAFGYSNIFVTAPSPENLKTLFEVLKHTHTQGERD